ncbi:uncharacterized protein encoded by LINC01547-like [Sapajus apella]|uniref:Uncharacterized protein encoded by LINC01547-like n=1 Tax=Sapajus apella TaxID=9515 RepID=A0A6J3HRD9_SAPAP|nr:uncharacterized protein encoded by LINC01547-like [Sapajus apella]
MYGWGCRRTEAENPSTIRNCVNQEWPEGSSPGLMGRNPGLMRGLDPARQDQSSTCEDAAGQEAAAVTSPSPGPAADRAGDAPPGCLQCSLCWTEAPSPPHSDPGAGAGR